MATNPYQPPTWAHPPSSQHQWTLKECKKSEVICTHDLTSKKSAVVTFGRAADMVDVPTSHETCSRVHARIAFDRAGRPWLRDLQSTHGTMVNGRRVPKESIGKYEDESGAVGSRGVMVFPGDQMQFGASTRIFVLEGPAEFSREREFKQNHGHRQQPEQQHSKLQEASADENISWGMKVSEEENEQLEDADSGSDEPLDYSKVPSSHQKLVEKVRAKEYKLSNLQLEMERIEAKGGTGMNELTEGQRTQLLRNQEREAKLLVEVQHLKHEIQMAIRGKHDGGLVPSLPHTKRKPDAEEDEDRYFDLTIDPSSSRRQTFDGLFHGSETEASLTSKWRELVATWKGMRQERESLQSRVHQLTTEISKANDDAEYDTFFLANDLQLNEEKLARVSKNILQMEEKVASVEKLLRVVNSKIEPDREKGELCALSATVKQSVSTSGSKEKEKLMVMLPPPSKSPIALESSEQQKNKNDFSMPPPPPKVLPVNGSMSVQDASYHEDPPGRLDKKWPPPSQLPSARPQPAKNTKSKAIGPMRAADISTASFFAKGASVTDDDKRKRTKTIHDKDNSITTSKETFRPVHDDNEANASEWVAPKGQDGSGLTRLNAKFAGRY